MNSQSMPNDMQSVKLPKSNYGYSAMRNMDRLESAEYTLCTLVIDLSGTTLSFRPAMEKCLQEIIKGLRHSPRADALMLRVVYFNSGVHEFHGFKLLMDCNPGDYAGSFQNYEGGSTALYDGCINGLDAMRLYSENLRGQEYKSNGILVTMTDGLDNASSGTKFGVRDSSNQALNSEILESLMTILIGVNINDTHVEEELRKFKDEVQFTQYEQIDNVTEKSFAKIANFISSSVTSQSNHLGTGGPSQALTF